jgi:hypothetical protein
MAELNRGGERIERVGLTIEIGRARLDRALVERFAAAADLDEQSVESAGLGGPDDRRDALGRGERGPRDPHAANVFGHGRARRARWLLRDE